MRMKDGWFNIPVLPPRSFHAIFSPMMRYATITLVFISVAVPASAADAIEEFLSPSKNIVCSFSDNEGVQGVRCDIINHADLPPVLPMPKDCDLDWGNMFIVSKTGKAGLECAGDLAGNPESAKTLNYGDVISHYGITCLSEKAGMTCINGDGHGFVVSRAAQKLF
jgi:hypothetical protein